MSLWAFQVGPAKALYSRESQPTLCIKITWEVLKFFITWDLPGNLIRWSGKSWASILIIIPSDSHLQQEQRIIVL